MRHKTTQVSVTLPDKSMYVAIIQIKCESNTEVSIQDALEVEFPKTYPSRIRSHLPYSGINEKDIFKFSPLNS